ncbi:MAG TPA: RES family NAD+ phosphorylase [Longimicrobium sp.]|nr:RES family NAD+ phosphorylase [Longimicrobium sp.]
MSPATAPGNEPGPPPLPPADLHARRLPIHVIEPDWKLWRIHPADRAPLFFGPAKGLPPRGRWDAPDGAFRVCYLAEHSFAAFAECFLREPATILLETEDLQARALSRVLVRGPLRLVAMHGAGLHALGATAAACMGDYAVSRAWAAALHDHPDAPDGIRYRARHDDDGFALALFDRAKRKVRDGEGGPLTGPPNVRYLAECLNRYGMGLI